MDQHRSPLFLAPLLFVILFLRSASAEENLLFSEQFADCQIDISAFHDIQSNTAALRFDAFTRDEAGIRHRCSPRETTVSDSLKSAFAVYKQQPSPPRLTSVFIGRLDEYDWIGDYLALLPVAGTTPDDPDNKVLEDLEIDLMVSGTLDPFRLPADDADYPLVRLSCEKLIRNRQGRPLDALCWLAFGPKE
ncbi:hypothetical protein O4H49_03485 [Kiloniella laminariae]|uniref:Uncharacterized protein n=1 Tax=Kiloniella laminariae TaxID=454162 RepID=A0ABT4LFW0_9PROT|nr:hypothetical protein [Kiloniella laminariae]MCZ4279825.1 hypothetical protein [Kiloniella laminariae]